MSTLLVTGASGHLGQLVLKAIAEANPSDTIIAGSRNPDKVDTAFATRRVDFDDANLADAFAGVDRLLIISTDAVDEPGKRLRQHRTAIAAAQKAGVKHIFYTSLPNAETSHVSFAPDHAGTEAALKESGLRYTILRNNWYTENLLMSLPGVLASGVWATANGQGRTGFGSRADYAAAIAAALLNPPEGNATFTLSGLQALTTDEVAALVSEVTGKTIQVVHIDDAALAKGMAEHGVPEFVIPTLVSFDTATRAGDLDIVTNDVETLSGRKPQTVKQWLEANKALLG